MQVDTLIDTRISRNVRNSSLNSLNSPDSVNSPGRDDCGTCEEGTSDAEESGIVISFFVLTYLQIMILYVCMEILKRNINSHRELKVWQRSIELSLSVYRLSSTFPKSEQFGLTSQLRRASVSIAANIAEGNGRHTDRDYAHFLSMAIGSAREVDTLLEIIRELGYGNSDEHHRCLDLLGEVNRMLESVHARFAGQVK